MAGDGLTRTNNVKRYATASAFPTTGSKGVIYIDDSTGILYTWNGSAYVSSVATEDFWDRDTTGDAFIVQNTLGDDLKLKQAGGDVVFDMDVSAETLQVSNTDVNGLVEVKDSSNVVQERLNPAGDNYAKGLSVAHGEETLADDAETTVASGTAGFGFVNIGDNQEYAIFDFSTTAVHLISNSANVTNADTDTNLCIYYSGANLNIKNRLGSELDARFTIWSS